MFEPGQKVICINDRERAPGRAKHPDITAGNVYTILDCRMVTFGPGMPDDLAVWLLEQRNTCLARDLGFGADRFRPINDDSIEVFRAMTRTKELEGV